MKNPHIIILFITAFSTVTSCAFAADSNSRYQTWQPPAGEHVYSQSGNNGDTEKYQKMIDKLNVLIDDAEKDRAADRRFIRDLRDVLHKYNWPWRVTLLNEDFMDGVVSKSPPWVIDSGDFKVKRGLGLYSNIVAPKTSKQSSKSSDEDLAVAILGAILKSASNKNGKKSSDDSPKFALIHVNKKISNAFAVKTTIDIRSTEGKIRLGLFQGKPGGSSYQLVFLPGPSAAIELLRVSSRGTTIIDVADNIQANGDRSHQLQWTRDDKGNMAVSLNGKVVIQTADRSLRDPFDGFSVKNQGGKFYLQSVHIAGIR